MENKHSMATIFTKEMEKDRLVLETVIKELINKTPKENYIKNIKVDVIDDKRVIVVESSKNKQ